MPIAEYPIVLALESSDIADLSQQHKATVLYSLAVEVVRAGNGRANGFTQQKLA